MFGLVRLTEEEKRVLLNQYNLGVAMHAINKNAASKRLHELGIPFKYTKQNGIEPIETP